MKRAEPHTRQSVGRATSDSGVAKQLREHLRSLSSCSACPDMIGPVVVGQPAQSKVLFIGQAPGTHEGRLGKPFAWTAGKTMFGWFASIGISEETFRERVYMAAVCRCFPGKNPKGGDRVPSKTEISNCGRWMADEVTLLRPKLVVPVGKLAIAQVFPKIKKLTEIIGETRRGVFFDQEVDVIALPHPSGASTWHRTEPGRTLLQNALAVLAAHPSFHPLLDGGGD